MTEPSGADAIVVGSGFGGSICALRLAEAGRSVLVLERGRSYPAGQFPRDPSRPADLLWRYTDELQARGLYDLRFFSGLGVVVASGVGGGSLVYAGVHIRPDASVFERWPSGFGRAALEPYYDMVAAMLDLAALPQDIVVRKRDLFRAAGRTLGRDVFDPPMAVGWRASSNGAAACALVAECEFGCQFGAKRTMDRTYLAAAQRLGARVQTGALVSHLEPLGAETIVHYRDVATGNDEQVSARRVVLAAGTLGTNEILLRSRERFGTMPKLSRALGVGFSANGDFLGGIFGAREDLEPARGTDVTSVIRYPDAPAFTVAAPTFAAPVMRFISALGKPPPSWLRILGPVAWPRLAGFLAFILSRGLWRRVLADSTVAASSHTTNLFAIGRDNAGGRVVLRDGKVDVVWDYAKENAELVERQSRAMAELAKEYGGTFLPLATWSVFGRIMSVHPLGGCRLSLDPSDGVVDLRGEVHAYPGVFVADGSVIPGSIGFHPAMTIAAVAERIASCVATS